MRFGRVRNGFQNNRRVERAWRRNARFSAPNAIRVRTSRGLGKPTVTFSRRPSINKTRSPTRGKYPPGRFDRARGATALLELPNGSSARRVGRKTWSAVDTIGGPNFPAGRLLRILITLRHLYCVAVRPPTLVKYPKTLRDTSHPPRASLARLR